MTREIMLFLHSHGVGTSRAVRIFKACGADAIQLISENLDRLARDIRGIGFKTADQIAQRPGIEPPAMIRARAVVSYALAGAMDVGHCGLPATPCAPCYGAHPGSRGVTNGACRYPDTPVQHVTGASAVRTKVSSDGRPRNRAGLRARAGPRSRRLDGQPPIGEEPRLH